MSQTTSGYVDQAPDTKGGQDRCDRPPRDNFPFICSFVLSQDAAPQETLQLTAEVTCSSSPHMRVAVCSSCQSREVLHNHCLVEILALIDIRRNVRPVKSHQGSSQMQRNPLLNDLMPPSAYSNSTAQRNSTSPLGLWSFLCASRVIVGITAKRLDLMSISRWSTTTDESWAPVRPLQS